jgi:hypothetical protein
MRHFSRSYCSSATARRPLVLKTPGPVPLPGLLRRAPAQLGPTLRSIQFCVGNEVEKAEDAEKTGNCNGQEGEHGYALSDECSDLRSNHIKEWLAPKAFEKA